MRDDGKTASLAMRKDLGLWIRGSRAPGVPPTSVSTRSALPAAVALGRALAAEGLQDLGVTPLDLANRCARSRF